LYHFAGVKGEALIATASGNARCSSCPPDLFRGNAPMADLIMLSPLDGYRGACVPVQRVVPVANAFAPLGLFPATIIIGYCIILQEGRAKPF